VNPRWLLWTVRGALLLALAVSTALLMDYSTASPQFCSVGSGCDTVRRSGLGYIPLTFLRTYVPVPVLGLVGFGLTFSVTLLSDWQKRRRWSLALLAAGGFIAMGFLLTQAFIGAFCSLCVVVDAAALVACGAAFCIPKQGWRQTREEELGGGSERFALKPAAWTALALVFAVVPWLWPKLKPTPPVPEEVLALYQPNKINVVEFADFQCPHCRRLHSDLKRIIADYAGQVNFVRMHMPLARHTDARPAARAAVCAGKQQREPQMADRLFAADSLDPKVILRNAQDLDLNLVQFKRCLEDEAIDRIIDEHGHILRKAGFEGLPTTFIGATKIVGAQPETVFRAAFAEAAQGDQDGGVPAWLYWPLAALLVVGVVFMGRVKPQTPQR
jgi:predicted DsbA family dithiol-disulfide isomerase